MMSDEIPVHSCHKLSVEYDVTEDRLLFHMQYGAEQTISFFMTARFVSLLIKHLFSHEKLASLKSDWETKPVVMNPLEEPVYPGCTERARNVDGASEPSDRPRETATTASTTRYPLCNRCNITVTDTEHIHLSFDLTQRTDPCFVRLELDQSATLQVLQIWNQKFEEAGWSLSAWTGSTDITPNPRIDRLKVIVH